MGSFYIAGETKTRPGVYQRISNRGTGTPAGAQPNVCAVTIQANWGPLATPSLHTSADSVKKAYGTAGTTDAATALFDGGASEVYAVRLGTGGTATTISITDNATPGVAAVTLTAKYVGDRNLTASIRDSVSDATKRQCLIYDGTTLLETLEFAKGSTGDGEPAALTAACSSSEYVTAEKVADGTKILATGSGTTSAGTNPASITTDDYSTAFTALEPYKWTIIVLDSVTSAIQTLLVSYLNRLYNTGKLCIGIVGDATTTTLANRQAAALALNDKKIVYFGSGWKTADGTEYNGYKAIAFVAGIIAATPNSTSIVHTSITGAAENKEELTDSDYSTSIQKGLLLLSTGPNGEIWFDSGINTLTSPAANEDAGWKKIRRVMTRFEMINRIDASVAPLIGQVNCDATGTANVIQQAQGVLNAMVSEGKLHADPAPTITLDPDTPMTADSAWFIIQADDLDSLEKVYLNYQFRFSTNS